MPTPQKSKSSGAKKSTARKTQRTSPNDAIKLLEADHRQVEKWFKEFEATNGQKTKDKLAEQICTALKVHTQIEEELFYPASREALPGDKLAELAATDELELIYLHLQSMRNFSEVKERLVAQRDPAEAVH